MEFTILKSDLVRELGLTQGVVEKRTTIPILSNVLVEASQDKITLTATDLELGVRSICSAKVKKPGAGTIPAKRLLDYVRLLPEGDVQLKFADNHWVSITSGRSKTRIAGMSRESYPELPAMAEKIADLPAAAETIPDFRSAGWMVMVAPAGTPEHIVRKVSDDLNVILNNPEVRSKLAAVGSYARPMSPQDTTTFIQTEQRIWGPLLDELSRGQ
jgi:hypothetical protein